MHTVWHFPVCVLLALAAPPNSNHPCKAVLWSGVNWSLELLAGLSVGTMPALRYVLQNIQFSDFSPTPHG